MIARRFGMDLWIGEAHAR